jgi:hypothetical protein
VVQASEYQFAPPRIVADSGEEVVEDKSPSSKPILVHIRLVGVEDMVEVDGVEEEEVEEEEHSQFPTSKLSRQLQQ